MKTLGILLVIVGVGALCVPGVRWALEGSARRTVSAEEARPPRETASVFPLMGVASMATGAAILVAGVITGPRKKSG